MTGTVVVIGAGSIGSLLALHLARGGLHVHVVDASPRAAQVALDGLRVDRRFPADLKVLEARPRDVVSTLESIPPEGLVLVATKAFDLDAVLRDLAAAGVIDPGRHAICLVQNGLGLERLARDRFPGVALVRASTTNGAMLDAGGTVLHLGAGHVLAGPWDGTNAGLAASWAARLVEAWNAGGLPASVRQDMPRVVWEKGVVNASINAPATLFNVTNGKLAAIPELLAIARALADESLAVARSAGVLHDFDARAAVSRVLEATAANRNSMLQDVALGRPTEIEFINGAMAAAGRAAGIDVPWNEAMVACIKALEAVGRVAGK